MKDDIAAAAAKAAPAVAVAGFDSAFNFTLDDWVKVVTLAYLILQALILLRTELRKRGDK